MRWLKAQYGDFTYQGDVARHLKSGNGLYFSFDLTSATDRFPLAFQRMVFERCFGADKAEAWAHIMVHYPFETPGGRRIHYRSGQPMGAYSSWAMFTMCHHLILQYIRKVHPDTVYAVLGDDIVIRGEDGAQLYKEVMSILDVGISETKSHVSFNTFEFAKRWFHNGIEVTPFPLNQLQEAGTDVGRLSRLILDVAKKGWYLGSDSHPRSILGYLKLQGTPGGLAEHLARRITRFVAFQKWAMGDESQHIIEALIPKVQVSDNSLCLHIERLSMSLKIGLSRAISKELFSILEKVRGNHPHNLQGLLDQTEDSAEYSDMTPPNVALGLIYRDLIKDSRKFEIDAAALGKMAVAPDWATTLGEASVSILKVIPIGRVPDPLRTMNERSAITATRNMLRCFRQFELFSAQFYATIAATPRRLVTTAELFEAAGATKAQRVKIIGEKALVLVTSYQYSSVI